MTNAAKDMDAMSFSTSKKGLWHVLVGLHRLIALHISHAMCKDTVAGRNDKMPTYYASSIAAASFLLLLAVAPALCKSRHRKAHPASIASALPPVLQATAVLVSPVCVGRSEVVGGDRRWRHRAAAAAVVLRFVQIRRRGAGMCAIPVRWRLRRLLQVTIWLKMFFVARTYIVCGFPRRS